MAFIQAPRAGNRCIGLTEFDEREAIGINRSLEQARMDGSEAQACFPHYLAGGLGFGYSLVSQGYVVPSGEEVEGVPGALPMSEEDETARHGAIVDSDGLWGQGTVLECIALNFSGVRVVKASAPPLW